MQRLKVRIALVCLMFALLPGCSSVNYFWQTAKGHVEIMAKAEPIEEVVNNPQTPEPLLTQLIWVQRIRDFSTEKLALPENRSYRLYADIGRRYPVWNVVAAPDDSLTLKRWCFPIVGCIAYKGFYAERDALTLGQELRDEGWDVAVSGVPAYSTLGYTADPVLSSFVNYPTGELARLIFHELAHQVVYIEDDTMFNESFASAVEELGVQAWLSQVGHESLRIEYESFDEKRKTFRALLLQARRELEQVYEKHQDNRELRLLGKTEVFQSLLDRYQRIKSEQWSGWSGYDRYFEQDLNNAKLALTGVYDEHVPAFKVLFARCGAEFVRFYEAVAALGALERERRDLFLSHLHAREPLPFSLGCDQAMFVPVEPS